MVCFIVSAYPTTEPIQTMGIWRKALLGKVVIDSDEVVVDFLDYSIIRERTAPGHAAAYSNIASTLFVLKAKNDKDQNRLALTLSLSLSLSLFHVCEPM